MSSATALASAGVKAVAAGNYADGIENLTKALAAQDAPMWRLERSKAYLRTNEVDLALGDAEMALRIAYDRANRDQMIEAQLRRAITFFRMGLYADADVCAFWAAQLCAGAKAMEQDGQLTKVDGDGDYTPRAKEVQDAMQQPAEDRLAAAMNAGARSKSTSLRNQAFAWRLQALTQMENLPAGHNGRKLHVLVKYPERADISSPRNIKQDSSISATHKDGGTVGTGSSTTVVGPSAAETYNNWKNLWQQYRLMYMKHKIRCSFYQSETTLSIDIFLKNLSSDQITIDCKPRIIKICPNQGVSLGGLSCPVVLLLHNEISPAATKYTVKSMKIEVVLQKQTPGKWPNFRCDNAEIVDNLSSNSDQSVPFDQFNAFISALGCKEPGQLGLPDYDSDQSAWYAALLETLRSSMISYRGLDAPSAPDVEPSAPSFGATSSNTDGADTKKPGAAASNRPPAYPTSSRKGPQNWDNIDDPDDENAKEGDVNKFFQDLYKGGNEDTKRAMMKSFVESNGTALSTSWSEAQGKTYQTSAPDGTEAKKWE
ncbi:SGS-domain-containing protein [Xylaria intraflava]|nr:SGS-domain-containing protein [Xylaria intraflava]